MDDTAIASQMSPYMVDLEEGKTYKFCRCGESKKLPFCDDSHKGSDAKPHTFTADKTECVNVCGCMESEDYPFCDGSHILHF